MRGAPPRGRGTRGRSPSVAAVVVVGMSGLALQIGAADAVQASGGHWSIVSSPSVPSQDNSLAGMTCVTGSDCWSVGDSSRFSGFSAQTLTEHWSHGAWSIIASPNVTGGSTHSNFLNAVACVSASDCWAVGNTGAGIGMGQSSAALAEHWNGTGWLIVATPDVTQRNNSLASVACVSSSDCWAAGTDTGNPFLLPAPDQTLTEHWNGKTWSIVKSADTSAASNNSLNAIACTARSNCWAAGFFAPSTSRPNQTLTEHWNGRAWSVVPSADTSPTQVNFLRSLACVAISDCWAAGEFNSGSRELTLTEHWNGKAWSIVVSSNRSRAQSNFLNALACVSGSDCWVAGFSIAGMSTPDQTLTEHWDGSAWSIVASPDAGVNLNNELSGAACTATLNCWVVGQVQGRKNFKTLTERFS